MTPSLAKINPVYVAVGLLVTAGILVTAISLTQPNGFPWIAFLSGCLITAVLALVYRLTVTNRSIDAIRRDLRRFDEDLPLMVAYAGDDEVIRSHNRAFRDWLRMRREIVDGHSLREVMGTTTYQQLKPGIDNALRGRLVQERHVHADSDRSLHLQLQNIPRKNDRGQVVGFFLTLIDLSQYANASDTMALPAQLSLAKPPPPKAVAPSPPAPMPAFAEQTMMIATAGRASPARAWTPDPAPVQTAGPKPAMQRQAPEPAQATLRQVAPPKVTAGMPDLVTTEAAPVMDGERRELVKTMTEELTTWKSAGGRLRSAIRNNEFCLYAQEIKPVANASGQATLFELLLRLQEEEDGLMPPGAFIPIAEEFGMLPDLDRWVVKHILGWVSRNPARQSVIYSVNIAGPTLSSPGFPELVALELKRYKLPGSILCFEIAEADAVADVPAASGFVRKLAVLGCHTAICGFGQAAGSYSLIKSLPVDYIKFDGSIVTGASRNEGNLTKLKAIARVARATNRNTVAEFVESEETLEILRSLGVDLAQGFGIAKPVPLSKLD